LRAVECKCEAELLARFAILALYKIQLYLPSSGVVIAGYGDKAYFPGYRQYTCYGNILGKFTYRQAEDWENTQITYHVHSHIKGFATTNMMDTFRFGISDQSWSDAGDECEQSLKNIADKLGQSDHRGLKDLISEEV